MREVNTIPWFVRRNRIERRIVEDHISGYALFTGLLGAPGLQAGKQLSVDANHIGRDGSDLLLGFRRAGGCLACRFGGNDRAHFHGLFAAQHRPAGFGETQRAIGTVIRPRKAERNQLTKHTAPSVFVQVGADGKHAKLIVTPLRHAFGVLAAQDIDEMRRAKALPRAINARQGFARRIGCIPGARRCQTVVAIAARLAWFTEIVEQAHAATACGFAQAQQRIELRCRDTTKLFVRIRLIDHAPLLHDICKAIGHPRICRCPIASRAASLLVIAFDAFRQIQMRYKSNIGFIDAHAEGNGCNNHNAVFLLKARLMFGAQCVVHACVIRQRAYALTVQPSRGFFHFAARQAIHDARIALMMVGDEVMQLPPRIQLVDDGVANVGTVETGNELPRVLQRESCNDFASRIWIRRRSQRDARHLRKAFVQQGKLQILRTKIVTPLRDTVGFVDGEQRDRNLSKQLQHARHEQALGRDIDKIEITGQQRLLERVIFRRIQRRIERGRANAELFECRDLILHQCDQRRNHHCSACA